MHRDNIPAKVSQDPLIEEMKNQLSEQVDDEVDFTGRLQNLGTSDHVLY